MEELCDLVPDANQADLESENTPDGMDGEQTWPTEEELKEVEAQGEASKRTIKIPRGTSDYQAAWIMDEAAQADSDREGEEEEEDEVMEAVAAAAAEEEEEGGSSHTDEEQEEEAEGDEEMAEEESGTVASTEEYDAKHVKFRSTFVIYYIPVTYAFHD
jgi:pre-rRNA-processing protein TSR1